MKQVQRFKMLLAYSQLCNNRCLVRHFQASHVSVLPLCTYTITSSSVQSYNVRQRCRLALSYCHAPFLSLTSLRHFGQPVSKTHPHLLSEGEVTPNITKEEYRKRRSALVDLARSSYKGIGAVDDHLFVFPSACKVHMANDIPYPFRQNSDFLYFSGFQEPASILVIHSKHDVPSASNENHTSVLFVQQKDLHSELWEGPRSGTDGAVELTGIDSAYAIREFEQYLFNYCKERRSFILWYDYVNPVQSNLHLGVMSQVINEQRQKRLENASKLTHALRAKKSASEIELMRETCRIASEAFVEVMKFSCPKVLEAHLWAKMDFECRIRGAQFLAYPPVVAGGARANTIHYTANNQVVQDGDLVLMDAGCEFHGYTSDITRTWPVSGQFSSAQRELYQAVLAVQTACIALCTPRNSLDDVYRQMLALLGMQLQALGLLPGDASVSEVISKARQLCPHHVGHYLGMDVHDVGNVSRSIKMEPGMIVTVEPGIYIRSDDMTVPEKYRGIGIRIEDNVLVTETSPVNLSQVCPKRIEDIERIMSK